MKIRVGHWVKQRFNNTCAWSKKGSILFGNTFACSKKGSLWTLQTPKQMSSFYKINIEPFLMQLLSSKCYHRDTTGGVSSNPAQLQKHMSINPFGTVKDFRPVWENKKMGGARNEISSHNKTTIKQDSFRKQRSTCDFSTGKGWRDEKTKVRLQSKHNICRGVLFHTWDVGQLHESERLVEIEAKTSQQLDAKCD